MSGINKACQNVGKMMARKLFAARGNTTEVHLTQDELALGFAGAAQVGFNIAIEAADRQSALAEREEAAEKESNR